MNENYNTHISFEFKGDGKSYFRIWVVNLFLSIVTLGVYSAWAKVRSNRYFYSHLYLDGSSFEYVANPLSIFLGRLIAVIVFLIYNLTSRYLPEFSIWLFAIFIPAVPWIVYKSLKFRARNSIFRNIRFGFHGTFRKAFLVMGVYPAIAFSPFIYAIYFVDQTSIEDPTQVGIAMLLAYLFSFIVFGYILYAFYAYVVNNSSYGKTRFTFSSSPKEYYGLLLKLFFSSLGLMLLLGIIAALGTWAGSNFLDEGQMIDLSGIFAGISGVLIYVWLVSMFSAGITNRLYNGLLIPAWYTFRSDVTSFGLFKVYLINTVLILLTVGMYIPFAKIRMIRYRVAHLKFVSTLNLDEFVFDSNEDVSAMGQEMGEMFDLGLSL